MLLTILLVIPIFAVLIVDLVKCPSYEEIKKLQDEEEILHELTACQKTE